MNNRLIIFAVIFSLVFSPLLFVPEQADAQVQKILKEVGKRQGIFILATTALGAVAVACTSPAGSAPGAIVNDDRCGSLQRWLDAVNDSTKGYFLEVAKILDTIFKQIVKRRILDGMVDQVINWIQGGGGNPQFVSDWRGFLQNAVNEGVGDIINDSQLKFLCSPFKAQLKISLGAGGGLSPLPVQKFSTAVTCTLDNVVQNIDAFYDDFRQGGWIAYSASWEPQNNFYGAALITLDAANRRIYEKKEEASSEALTGGGFLSQKKCSWQEITPEGGAYSRVYNNQTEKQVADARRSATERGNTLKVTNCQIITPGSVAGDLVKKAVGTDFDFILNADDLSTYATAITNALVNRLADEGSKGLIGIGKQSDPQNAAYASDDPSQVVSLPDDLIQGGPCRTEDDPATPEDEEGEEGVFVVNALSSSAATRSGEFFCLSLVPRGESVLSAQNLTRRKEMIDTYRRILQHSEWLLLLKIKTRQHYNSLVKIVKTLNRLYDQTGLPEESNLTCKDGTDFGRGKGADFGTSFEFYRGADTKFRWLGVKMAVKDGEFKGEYAKLIDDLDQDIENLPKFIEDMRNRLNLLQAPAGIIEEKLFLHSVHTSTSTPPHDAIITPFHYYGDAGLGGNIGKEIGRPVLLVHPEKFEEGQSIGELAAGLSPKLSVGITEEEDVEPEDAGRSLVNPQFPALPNFRRVSASAEISTKSRLQNLKTATTPSLLLFGTSIRDALRGTPEATPDESVYGRATLNNEQVDALYKSFIKFSLEQLPLVSTYANPSHPFYQLDLKREEYRARELHYWLFTRNMYVKAEYADSSNAVGSGGTHQEDGALKFILSPNTSLDQINSPAGSPISEVSTTYTTYSSSYGGGIQVERTTIYSDDSGKYSGGGIIGEYTVNLQDINNYPEDFFVRNKGDKRANSTDTVTTADGEIIQIPVSKVGLFTWCTSFPIFNPELF